MIPTRGTMPVLLVAGFLSACATMTTDRYPGLRAPLETTEFTPREGVYVAAMLPYHEHGNDDTVVSGGGSAEALPELDPGTGSGFALGMRTARGAIEFNYQSTDHEASNTTGFDSQFVGYNLDMKLLFRQGMRFQPLLLLGLGIQCVTVEDGSVGSGGEVEDATFNGLGVQLGVGVKVHVTDRVGLTLQGGQRFTSYASVDGVVDGELGSNIDDDGRFASVGLEYVF